MEGGFTQVRGVGEKLYGGAGDRMAKTKSGRVTEESMTGQERKDVIFKWEWGWGAGYQEEM